MENNNQEFSRSENQRLEELQTIARKNELQLDSTRIDFNESGLDFIAAFADDEDGAPWVLRIPRRPDVAESAVYEYQALRLIRSHLPVAVPDWRIHTPELIAYPLLKGTPAATIDQEAKQYLWHIDHQSLPTAFTQSLAEALAALHHIGYDEASQAGIRVMGPDQLRPSLAGKMETIRREFGVSPALWERWQQWLSDESYWPRHTALIHGDLHPGHMVVDESHRVTGLLDWTEAEFADPAVDFVAYYAVFGEQALTDLLERYRQAGGRVWPRILDHIKELQSAYPVFIGLFAIKSGLEEYKQMARQTLGVSEPQEENE